MRKAVIIAGLALAAASCTQQPNQLTGRWEVQEIAGASLGEGVDIWLAFDPSGERVSGFTGCNTFSATAEQFGTGVSFAPVVEVPGECPSQAAATDEARFLGVIPSVQRYIRHGRSLELLPAQNGAEALLRLRLADEQEG